jgi:lipopolysaccharide export LptBFGC system permease protein LptF
MSKTIFWYLFRDLVRIFMLASGALAGIMSFGGLMRPLTENGLDASQVGKMLTYLMPAMMAYSVPAAALFATTVVYGRLAADNELTACRAAGMSYTSIGLPAVVLGLVVAILSLVLLCFVVPIFSLKVEEVISSNLAQVVVNKIGRDHQIRLGSTYPTVFAEEAHIMPSDPAHKDQQIVQLVGPTVVSYEKPDETTGLRVPKDFFTAESALLHIHSSTGGQVRIDMNLLGGAKFPREFTGANRSQIGMETVTPPPLFQENPIRQNFKFANVWELMALADDPSASQRVSEAVAELVQRDEAHTFLQRLIDGAGKAGAYSLSSATKPMQQFILSDDGPPPVLSADQMTLNSASAAVKQVHLTVIQGEQTTRTALANQATLQARTDEDRNLISVTLELRDLTMRTADAGLQSEPAALSTWTATIDVPMDDAIKQLRTTRTLKAYAKDASLDPHDANHLRREQVVVNNDVRAELNGRASFAVSCLILVLVGCALGMMFKSGNFLTAFAVSFAPALLCIALVVAGQQTADHVPEIISAKFMQHNRPLHLGLALIWSGNAIVLALAVILIGKLRRR